MHNHVFILHGNLPKLACDAWLLTCGPTFQPRAMWTDEMKVQPSAGRRLPGGRVAELANWPAGHPRPWLVNTGGLPEDPFEWYAEGVRQFFTAAAPAARSSPVVRRRDRVLLGVPLVGAGKGGQYEVPDGVLRQLLPLLRDLAAEHNVDVALVLRDEVSHSAALRARREQLGGKAWPDELTNTLRSAAVHLADRASEGNLVLFLGAGVSAGANVPTWNALLADLALEAGLLPRNDASRRKSFEALGPLDAAGLIDRALAAQGKQLRPLVAEAVAAHPYHSLCHGLLAGMPVEQVVTTNYDPLFELACAGTGRPVARLPYEARTSPGRRWVLKMHGDVEHPEEIVLTRTDYLRYEDRHAALGGIVQALLITKHMAFLGFSLNDNNHHRIVDDVRRAVRDEGERGAGRMPFGTCISTEPNPLLRDLWSEDLHWVDTHAAAAAAGVNTFWLHEVFVDYLAAACHSMSRHLMDPRFDLLLTKAELDLRDLLSRVLAGATDEIRSLPAWGRIEEALVQLGADPASVRRTPL